MDNRQSGESSKNPTRAVGLSRKKLKKSIRGEYDDSSREVEENDADNADADEYWHSTPIDKFGDDGEMVNDFENVNHPSQSPVRLELPPQEVLDNLPVDDDDDDEDVENQGQETMVDDAFENNEQQQQQHDPVLLNFGSQQNYFCSILKRFGLFLMEPRIQMKKDELVFRKELTDWFNSRDCGKVETDRFIKSMLIYYKNEKSFLISLYPCVLKAKGKMHQSSLLHMLLSIDVLQKDLLEFLFRELAQRSFIVDDSKSDALIQLVLILGQLKWINNWSDTDFLVKELINYLETSTEIAQKEIIKSLPEIIPETYHYRLADSLKKLIASGKNTPALMDCIGDLAIPESDFEMINEDALDAMVNAPASDFPAYFGFLFRSKNEKALTSIIDRLRQDVEISPLGSADVNNKSDVNMIEIVQKVKFCIAMNPNIVVLWNKSLKEGIEGGVNPCPLDLLMLFIFAENNMKSSIYYLKLIFKNKRLALELVDFILENNFVMILQILKTVLKICEMILSEKDVKSIQVCSKILVKLFLKLELLEAQEVIAIFATNFINGSYQSRDAVLSSLSELVSANAKKLLTFTPHLMGVMEFIVRFPPMHLKGLMNILAQLAYIEEDSDSERFQSELSIMVRKQLTHTKIQTRCFGVISTMAVLRKICTSQSPELGKIEEMLKTAWNYIQKDEDPCIIFFDELGEIVNLLPEEILEDYDKMFLEKFEEVWVINKDLAKLTTINMTATLKLRCEFDANPEITEDKIIFILEQKQFGMSSYAIPAHFRLIKVLVNLKNDGDLEAIDALVGAPVFFPSIELYFLDESTLHICTYSQKNALGTYIILTINLFREIISAFVGHKEGDIRLKILFRLLNLVQLQKFLVKHIKEFEYLPIAYPMDKCDGKALIGNPLLGQGTSKQAKKGDKKGRKEPTKPKKPRAKKKKVTKKKKKKNDENSGDEESDDEVEEEEDNDDNDDEVDEEEEEETTEKKKPRVKSTNIQPPFILPFLRRFDLRVFSLLKYPLETTEDLAEQSILEMISTSHARTDGDTHALEKLGSETLILLLSDIFQQIENTRIKFDIFKVENFLKYVCNHLDQLAEYYQHNATSNKFDECFRLLMKSLAIYFNEILKLDHGQSKIKCIQAGINTLGIRVESPKTHKTLGFPEKIEKAVEYISKFSDFMKDAKTGVEYLKFLKNFNTIDEIKRNSNDTFKNAIDEAADNYLKKNWKLFPADIGDLLTIWLENNNGDLDLIETIVESILPDGIPSDIVFRTCTKFNFYKWHSILFQYLAAAASKQTKKSKNPTDSVAFWKSSVVIFGKLINVSGLNIKKDVIIEPLLKHSRAFLEAFINNIGILKHIYEISPHEGSRFIKSLQKPSRQLHNICIHSKVSSSNHLMRQVPYIRRVLEKIIFRVGEIIQSVGCTQSFSIGKLAFKNLEGDKITSQPFNRGEDSWDEDEDDENEDEDLSQIWQQKELRLSEDSSSDNEVVDLDESSNDIYEQPRASKSRKVVQESNEDGMDVDLESENFEGEVEFNSNMGNTNTETESESY